MMVREIPKFVEKDKEILSNYEFTPVGYGDTKTRNYEMAYKIYCICRDYKKREYLEEICEYFNLWEDNVEEYDKKVQTIDGCKEMLLDEAWYYGTEFIKDKNDYRDDNYGSFGYVESEDKKVVLFERRLAKLLDLGIINEKDVLDKKYKWRWYMGYESYREKGEPFFQIGFFTLFFLLYVLNTYIYIVEITDNILGDTMTEESKIFKNKIEETIKILKASENTEYYDDIFNMIFEDLLKMCENDFIFMSFNTQREITNILSRCRNTQELINLNDSISLGHLDGYENDMRIILNGW